MNIGEEQPAIVIEPLEIPVPDTVPAVAPEPEREREPEKVPVPVRREKVPA